MSLISSLISWILARILALYNVRVKHLAMEVNIQSSGVFQLAVFGQTVVVRVGIIKRRPNPDVALQEIP